VLAAKLAFVRGQPAVLEQLLPLLLANRRAILAHDQLVEREQPVAEVVAGVADQVQQRTVGLVDGEPATAGHAQDAGLEQGAEPGVALTQRELDQLALGDVDRDAGEPGNRTVRASPSPAATVEPARA